MTELLYVALVSMVFAMSPGPSTAMLFIKSWRDGVGSAVRYGLGETTGDMTYVVAAVFSLGALAEYMVPYAPWLRYMAAAMLVWMGVSAWRAGSRPVSEHPKPASAAGDFILGYLMCLSNPKVMAFYLVFFPAFVDLSEMTFGLGLSLVLAVMSGIVAGTALVVVAGYLTRAHTTRRMPRRMPRRLTARLGGSVLVSLGLAVSAG